MEHVLEIYRLPLATNARRWGCRCSCGWQTPRPQTGAQYAQQRGLEHVLKEEVRTR